MRMSQSLSRKDVPLCFSFIISIALILLRIFIGLPRKIRVIKLIRAFWFWAGSGDIPEIFSRRRVCELIEQSHIIKCFHLPPSLSFDRHVQKIPLKWSISTYSFKSEAILRTARLSSSRQWNPDKTRSHSNSSTYAEDQWLPNNHSSG